MNISPISLKNQDMNTSNAGKGQKKPNTKKITQSAHENKSDKKNPENCLKNERGSIYMPVKFFVKSTHKSKIDDLKY